MFRAEWDDMCMIYESKEPTVNNAQTNARKNSCEQKV
jgi:hypothetical protein